MNICSAIRPPTRELAIGERDAVFAPVELAIILEARQRTFHRLRPGLKLEDALTEGRRAGDGGSREELLGKLDDSGGLGRRALELAQKPFAIGVEHLVMCQNQAPAE